MSRFSKSEAEKRGWRFVHAQKEETVLRAGDTLGRSQVLPPSYRAEKYVSTRVGGETLVNEEAETMGLLLERIHLYEQHQDSIEEPPLSVGSDTVYPYADISVLDLRADPKTADGENKRDPADNETFHESTDEVHRDVVHTPLGDFNEHEWSGRRTEEVLDAHEDFLRRQREFELAKPIDPTPTRGERNEQPAPQDFGPPVPETEILIAQGPGPERSELVKDVDADSEPSDTEEEARSQIKQAKGKKDGTLRKGEKTGTDSPPIDNADQLVEAPDDSPTDETEDRMKEQAVSTEPEETTTGADKERKRVEKKSK